jgi:hypothetical protein
VDLSSRIAGNPEGVQSRHTRLVLISLHSGSDLRECSRIHGQLVGYGQAGSNPKVRVAHNPARISGPTLCSTYILTIFSIFN